MRAEAGPQGWVQLDVPGRGDGVKVTGPFLWEPALVNSALFLRSCVWVAWKSFQCFWVSFQIAANFSGKP